MHKFSDATGREMPKSETVVNAYKKSAFGIVHVRTDGERVLVATPSGRFDKKEAYAFRLDSNGEITFEDEPRVV